MVEKSLGSELFIDFTKLLPYLPFERAHMAAKLF